MQVWNLLEKRLETEFEAEKNFAIVKAAIANNKSFIISGSTNGTIIVWNIPEKRKETEFLGHSNAINSIAITNDNRFAVSCSFDFDNSLRIWDLVNKIQVAVFDNFCPINSLSITNDNDFIVFGSTDKNVKVLNFLDKSQEAVLKGHSSSVESVAITKDNHFVISADDNTVRVWNLIEKREESVIHDYAYGIKSAQITRNGQFVVIEHDDFSVKVCSIQSKSSKYVIKNETFSVQALVSKLRNKVYLSTGFGISVLDLDEGEIYHDFFFDKKFEEFYNEDYWYEENLLPSLA